MQEEVIIKKFFEAVNSIVISEMYLKQFCKPDNLELKDLKNYNPGHLGSSMSVNFILANLYYFLNKNDISSKIVLGTGHSGVALMSNLWLNGTLEKYYPKYSCDKKGLDNLINDFGNVIRSEINPEYPETIYDGGELGYSLGVSYGYALNGNVDIVPCIIGDGEAETGTLCSSWQLNKLINTKSKVLPIINLNGLKMGSKSFLSMLSNEEVNNYFKSLGYDVFIVDASNKDLLEVIKNMQEVFSKSVLTSSPLIIFKSLKGYTLSSYEGNISVHKNPLSSNSEIEKLEIIKSFLDKYDMNIFDSNGKVLSIFNKFKQKSISSNLVIPKGNDNIVFNKYIMNVIRDNNGTIFSPDEIFSNGFGIASDNAIEILNENLLQALYQGYVMAGNFGIFIGYEGFMPILSSMITQYYKYLKQKDNVSGSINNSLNYILTSTCLENTYSHQNPDFINSLLEKNDKYYNIFFPRDEKEKIKCFNYCLETYDKINIVTFSKRHKKEYSINNTTNNWIDIVIDNKSPELILAVTGDYMLDNAMDIYNKINKKKIKIIYITKPQILDINNSDGLSNQEFNYYFNLGIEVIYLFNGYPSTIKSLLFERRINCEVYGYSDGITAFGNYENNIKSNNISSEDIINRNKILRRIKDE